MKKIFKVITVKLLGGAIAGAASVFGIYFLVII